MIFGPKPRSYNLAMNRKERRLALRTALMSRVADITVVKGFGTDLDTPAPRRSPRRWSGSESRRTPRCW